MRVPQNLGLLSLCLENMSQELPCQPRGPDLCLDVVKSKMEKPLEKPNGSSAHRQEDRADTGSLSDRRVTWTGDTL